MKLEVGMYVRTNEGFIAKIQSINEDSGFIDCDSSVKTMYEEHYSWLYGGEVELVVKASHNIIDLIEVGDYVNGFPVIHKENDILKCGLLVQFKENEIKSIVTKKQFESMIYKVEREED